MKLIKIPVMAGSAILNPRKNFYINTKDIYEVDGAALVADSCVIKFVSHGVSDDAATTVEGTVTILMDGADTAEKTRNANKLADYIAEVMQQSAERSLKKPFDLIPTLADIHAVTKIVKTGGSGNDAIVSITLS
tara:strand:- start:19 stop:420 length:402 start_codon:yes stop_codon:yes gene_type:complete